MPTKPGVYFFKNSENKIIYIGKAKSLKDRVSSYFSDSRPHDAKTLKLIADIKSADFIVVQSEIDAFLLEATLIKKHKPFYNIKMSDDKSYPYIKITKSAVPSVTVVRKKNDKKAYYFGPYPDGSNVKTILRIIRRIFPFESVENHPKKRCLYNHIGLCPCASVIPENKLMYKKNIAKIRSFLDGKKDLVLKDLLKEQKEYIKREEFENASIIQKQIDSINSITSERFDPHFYSEKPDFYFTRINDEIKSLKDILLKYFPEISDLERIECYDISNIQGTNPSASMVVFKHGDSDKSQYRRFKIKSKSTPDDFRMMEEVVNRRFRRDGWENPDLVVVDGGKGQVGSAIKAMVSRNVSVPIIGLAKKEETIVIPINTGRSIEFLEIKLPKSTPGINLLRRLRDEAHRFAITYHRNLRSKSFLTGH